MCYRLEAKICCAVLLEMCISIRGRLVECFINILRKPWSLFETLRYWSFPDKQSRFTGSFIQYLLYSLWILYKLVKAFVWALEASRSVCLKHEARQEDKNLIKRGLVYKRILSNVLNNVFCFSSTFLNLGTCTLMGKRDILRTLPNMRRKHLMKRLGDFV
jgi:hypothetical protein